MHMHMHTHMHVVPFNTRPQLRSWHVPSTYYSWKSFFTATSVKKDEATYGHILAKMKGKGVYVCN